MGVNKVDAEALQTLEAFARGLVRGKSRADLRVVERHGREMETRSIKIKIATLDPELAEAEACGPMNIKRFTGAVQQRELEAVDVLWCVDVPGFVGHPFFRE